MTKKTKTVVFAAMLAAIITVCTRFTAIPIFGSTGGYVHVGDTFVFLSAALLPTPYAIAASAIGGALADLLSGFPLYILPTAIIKGLMAAMFFGKKRDKLLTRRNLLSLALGVVILVVGYYIAEVIMTQSFGGPLLGMVWNLAQGIFSCIGFILLALALDAARIRDRLQI